MSGYRKKAFGYLLGSTVIWGVASVVIKYTLNGIDPLPFLGYRFLISGLIALIFIPKIILLFKKHAGSALEILIHSVLATTISLGFLFLGLDQTTVLNLVLITLAAPLITEYAGVFFLKEHLTKREKIGTIFALFGTFFTVIEPIFNNQGGLGEFMGNLLILVYLISDTAAIIILKKLLKKDVDVEALTHTSFLVGFLTLLPIIIYSMGLSFVTTIINLPFKFHLGVLYMAVFSGTIAYYLRNKGQKSIEVGEASLFGYLTQVVSTLAAIFFLKETVTPLFFLGACVILIGVIYAEYKPALFNKTNTI